MTQVQIDQERLAVAISELEEALDYFDNDEAFVAFVLFQAKLGDLGIL